MLLFCVAAASGAPLGEAVGPLSYTHELSVGRSPPYRATVNELTQTLSTTAANRTIELVQWADKCARIVPPNLDVQRDCFNLAIAGSGSRTIYDMAKNDGWKRAVHAHSETVITQLAESSPPPRCALFRATGANFFRSPSNAPARVLACAGASWWSFVSQRRASRPGSRSVTGYRSPAHWTSSSRSPCSVITHTRLSGRFL